MKTVGRVAMGVALAGLMLAPASQAKDKTENEEPVAWGMLSGNTGCVIFKESKEVDSEMTPGGGFTSETVKVLETVDAMNAVLPEKKYPETKEQLDKLQTLSVQNHWKYVKIPKKYTPEQMEKAKAMCGLKTGNGQ